MVVWLEDSTALFFEINMQSKIWKALTGSQILSNNFDYHRSVTFFKHIEVLNLPHEEPNLDARDGIFDAFEDEELAKALDHHSIITSQLPDDYIQTADEIIEEIDRLMVGETELDLDLSDPHTTTDTPYILKNVSVLNQMSIMELNSLVDELEACIRHHSACLVRELARRDELEYEQELKEIFFTRLHQIQNRTDEWMQQNPPNSKSVCAIETDERSALIKGTNSTAAKTILANAAAAVQRRWRRMGHSLENARFNLRRNSQSRGASESDPNCKMFVSNSNIELASEETSVDDEMMVRSESYSVTATSIMTSAGHSPRRHHRLWLTGTSMTSFKQNPEKYLKFLSTKIPYHRSSNLGWACNGPTVGQLEVFNEFLLYMLTNNPNLTPLLTDYILNVYAPGEEPTPKLFI